jgi:hypothetical protein
LCTGRYYKYLLCSYLFEYSAVKKSVGGGYILSCLIKVLVPYKEEYEIIAAVLREERAKNARDSSTHDAMRIYKEEPEKKAYRAQGTRIINRDDKKLFLHHASAEDKSSALGDADSDQKFKIEGLAHREIGNENNGNQILAHITELLSMNGREYCSFSVPLRSGTAEFWPLRSSLSDHKYRQGNAQDNVQSSTKEYDVRSTQRRTMLKT